MSAPVDAAPANLHEEMCGPHRKRPAAEEEEQEANEGPADSPYAVFLSSLRPQAKGASLLQTEANLGDGLFNAPDFIAHGGRYGVGTDSNVVPSQLPKSLSAMPFSWSARAMTCCA